jgi:type I restriction enzyme S subunit
VTALPSGWQYGALKDVCLSITKSDPAELGRETIRYIDIGSVDGSRHAIVQAPEIQAVGAPSRCRQIVQAGDTVFSTVRPYLEKIAYVDEALDGQFASTGFCVLRPGPRLLPRYLHYFSISHTMLDQVLPFQKGVSYPAVLDREVRATTIPVPPLDEQRRIVDLLEDHLSRLDAAQQAFTDSFRRLSALRDAFLSKAVAQAHASAGVVVSSLGSVSKVSSGLTALKGNKAFYEGGTIPWITSADLHQGLITRAKQFVTQAALDATTLKVVPAGALLIAMYGEGKTRGTAAELGIDATTNQACAAVALHDPRLRGVGPAGLERQVQQAAPSCGRRRAAEPQPLRGWGDSDPYPPP